MTPPSGPIIMFSLSECVKSNNIMCCNIGLCKNNVIFCLQNDICIIGEECYEDGALNPLDPSRACKLSVNARMWFSLRSKCSSLVLEWYLLSI